MARFGRHKVMCNCFVVVFSFPLIPHSYISGWFRWAWESPWPQTLALTEHSVLSPVNSAMTTEHFILKIIIRMYFEELDEDYQVLNIHMINLYFNKNTIQAWYKIQSFWQPVLAYRNYITKHKSFSTLFTWGK